MAGALGAVLGGGGPRGGLGGMAKLPSLPRGGGMSAPRMGGIRPATPANIAPRMSPPNMGGRVGNAPRLGPAGITPSSRMGGLRSGMNNAFRSGMQKNIMGQWQEANPTLASASPETRAVAPQITPTAGISPGATGKPPIPTTQPGFQSSVAPPMSGSTLGQDIAPLTTAQPPQLSTQGQAAAVAPSVIPQIPNMNPPGMRPSTFEGVGVADPNAANRTMQAATAPMRRASAHPLIAPSVAGGPKYPSAHPLISPSPGIFNQLGQTPAAPNLTDVSPSGLGLPHTPGRVDPAMPAKVPFRQGNKLAAVSPQGMEMVKDLEGFSPKAYWDHKQYSVGYGTRAKGADHVVTKTQATKMLKDRMQHNSKLINKMVKVPLNQNQLDALGSFMYNVGSGNFRDSTLLKKLNTGDYTGASKEFEVWNKASGKVHPGLINRRAQEQKLFNTPVSEPQSQLEQTAGQGTQLADLAGQQLGEFAGPIPKHYQDIGSFRSTLKLGETHNTSWNNFQTLKPQFQKQVARVLKDLEKQGYQPLVRNAMRSKAQMLKNFKAGSGARKSIHGLRQGADIVDRRAYKPSMYDRAPKGFWKALNKAARKQGLRSGLYWKKRDRPHIDTGWGVRY